MKLFNSLNGSKEDFIPLNDKQVSLYVCGITPYDTTHLGHAFTYIFFDALIRYLKFQGYKVTYTQNVTDINDRDKDILQRAKEQNIAWNKLAQYWTEKFLTDMQTLNWLAPTNYLYASQQIPAMINLIQKLLDNKMAYQINGSVYSDISRVDDYGKLSKLSAQQMLKIARDFEEDVDNQDKKQPLDITLWRAAWQNQPPYIPKFTSPWGLGRPGWHIECSAMSISSLDELIDIHGGGKDLIFPHHEAEIAQSEGATGKIPFVKYWLHTGAVFYEGAKMSKSKGNLVMISDLLKKYSPNSIRWLLLSHNWQKDWEFKDGDLKEAQKDVGIVESVIAKNDISAQSASRLHEFTSFMDDNLNTPQVLGLLLQIAKTNSSRELKKLYEVLGFRV
ncbi:cysteine--tRNA ligase [Candidatus Microgenomates bacterium]|nr:cysteine--tRNA ligase [Candidatus Microgenomates bacterium]